jgi:protein-S-isoprenylcysteine O-methyltransferase Ste14
MATRPEDIRRLFYLLPSSILFFLIVPSATLVVGARIDSVHSLPIFPVPPINYAIGAAATLSGALVVYESIRALLVDGRGVPLGDLFPSQQSRRLITTGVYSSTRNPMLLGYLVALSGLGCALRSPSAFLILPVAYALVWTAWIKGHEEPRLERRFGEEYVEYRAATPFFIPRLRKPKA